MVVKHRVSTHKTEVNAVETDGLHNKKFFSLQVG